MMISRKKLTKSEVNMIRGYELSDDACRSFDAWIGGAHFLEIVQIGSQEGGMLGTNPLACHIANMDSGSHVNAVGHDVGGFEKAVRLLVAPSNSRYLARCKRTLFPGAKGHGGSPQVAIRDEGAMEQNNE